MLDLRDRPVAHACALLLSFSIGTTSIVGCGSDGGQPLTHSIDVTSSPAHTPTYDGETILRGLFFGRGPVAAQFPELWNTGTVIGEQVSQQDPRVLADELDKFAGTACAQGCSDATRDGLRTAAARLRAGEKERLVLADPDATYTQAQGPAADAAVDLILLEMESADPAFFDRFAADLQSGSAPRVSRAIDDATSRIVEAAGAVGRSTKGGLSADALTPALLTPHAPPDGDGSPVVVYLVVAVVVILAITVALSRKPTDRVGDSLDYERRVESITRKLSLT